MTQILVKTVLSMSNQRRKKEEKKLKKLVTVYSQGRKKGRQLSHAAYVHCVNNPVFQRVPQVALAIAGPGSRRLQAQHLLRVLLRGLGERADHRPHREHQQ